MAEQTAAPATEQASSAAPETLVTAGTAPEASAQPTAPEGTAPAAGDQQQTQQKAPEQYADFTLPDGYKLDGEIGDKFKAVAKDLDLTQEQAQKLIDLDVQRVTAQTQQLHATSAAWVDATKADKEIGGDNLNANLAVAQKALAAFGTPELKNLLQETGLGNNPEIIRAFYRAGKAIGEDSFVPAGSGASKGPSTPAQALYGSKK